MTNFYFYLFSLHTAVRAAGQCHLHQTFSKALHGDQAAYWSTRLHYLVFVCDHHFSIPYGRQPLTRESEATQSTAQFLALGHATEDDARLVSQVDLWSTTTQIQDTFGFNVDVLLRPESTPVLRRCMIALDTWRADWNEKFGRHIHVGEYPRKGVGLHFHFAKLYLCSHAFRGMQSLGQKHQHARVEETLHPELEEIAIAAIDSSKSILKTAINDEEVQGHLNGLPLYFHNMIVFALVFLLKVATRYADVVPVDNKSIADILRSTASVFRSITGTMHRQHLLVTIACEVEKLLGRQGLIRESGSTSEFRRVSQEPSAPRNDPGPVEDSNTNVDMTPLRMDLLRPADGATAPEVSVDQGPAWDLGFDWLSYDFLAPQDMTFDQESWGLNLGFTSDTT